MPSGQSLAVSRRLLQNPDETSLTFSLYAQRILLPPLRINLRSVLYIITKEVRNRALDNNKFSYEDENEVTIDTNNDSELDFDSLDNNEFNPILRVGFRLDDKFIDVN